MQAKEKHDLVHLETRIKELSNNFSRLASEQEFQDFIKRIHQPGWTTPAEFTLVSGIVENMIAQTKSLANLKQTLIEGGRLVGAS